MAPPKGNKYWMLRSKHGRDKLFSTPELLWEAACEYFQWCDENPWSTRKEITKNKKQKELQVSPISRPYSLMGLCVYVGASASWWREFRSNCAKKNKNDFLAVIARIEGIINTQQFEGACVGAFNANIISRTLGLADKKEINAVVPTGLNIVVNDKDEAALIERLKDK